LPEAYLFASAPGSTPVSALDAALSAAGLVKRALGELVWLGAPLPELPGDAPLTVLPDAPIQAHFTLQSLLRRLIAGERGLFALGQSAGERHACLLLGGPAVVGRLNLLPLYRLHPAPPLPAPGAEAAEDFRLALRPLLPEEPTPADAPPLIISPAAPPPKPVPTPEPPVIQLLLCESGETGLYPTATRIPPAPGLISILDLLPELDPSCPWGAWVTPLARGFLLTLVEHLSSNVPSSGTIRG
jgi:hypothetical protein